MWEHIIAGAISRPSKSKVIGSSENIFMKGQIMPENIVAFCNGMTSSVGEGKTVDICGLDLCKTFSAVSCNIHIDKLMKYGLDKWTVRWIDNCLNYMCLKGCYQWYEVQLNASCY